ncbi:NarK/NasA family nitrate transporter [Nocardioides panacisoli]|uniref:MFS transporter n=1 Tax=Nocardioides panacisoli TaxID=627624 RepID=UPI001C628BA4|nr:nitrate/nitrite transporter [Nocardioides panacisoli]QYJ03150.1 NarK/NasA family nitrate transporter [Nocardioides panacisoli]
MTTTTTPTTESAGSTATAGPGAVPPGGTWLTDWRPEDEDFWQRTGRRVARRNLVWSIFAEHVGFSIWLFWSISAALLASAGFDFSAEQLFYLVAVPNAVGAFMRLPYTFAVPVFGGRNWTVISALLLLVPTVLYAVAVQNPDTPYWAFVVIAATAGVGGGNFSSSMANINAFYPARAKGLALGINAAGGNIGAAVIQLGLPVIVGAGGLFGMVRASEGGVHLETVAYLYALLALVGAAGAHFFMNNLAGARSTVRQTAAVVRQHHTLVMSVLYIGTFGSFIGYASAMPLVIKLNFSVVDDGVLTGINFAWFAFLGATVGSLIRPLGGWLADRYGGARVSFCNFLLQAAGTLGILWSLSRLTPNPTADPQVAIDNEQYFPVFLAMFLLVFAFTGIGNGSTFKMIPAIWRAGATARTAPGTPERDAAVARATVESSAVVGIVAAVGAFGGFLVPMMFAAPWVDDKVAAISTAFWIFTVFYVACAALTWAIYLRPRSAIVRAAETRI